MVVLLASVRVGGSTVTDESDEELDMTNWKASNSLRAAWISMLLTTAGRSPGRTFSGERTAVIVCAHDGTEANRAIAASVQRGRFYPFTRPRTHQHDEKGLQAIEHVQHE